MKSVFSASVFLLVMALAAFSEDIESIEQCIQSILKFQDNSDFSNLQWIQADPIEKMGDLVIKKTSTFKYKEATFSLKSRYSSDNVWNDILLTMDVAGANSFFVSKNLYNILESLYGKPIKIVDIGFANSQIDSNSKDIRAQWNYEDKTITFTSINMKINSEIHTIGTFIQISLKENVKEITELVALKLRTEKIKNPRTMNWELTRESSIILILDLDTNSVMNQSYIKVGKIISKKDTIIEVLIAGKDEDVYFYIERYDSLFIRKIITKIKGAPVIEISGTFEVVDLGKEKKF